MALPKITSTVLIPTSEIPKDPNFMGLRIIHAEEEGGGAAKAYNNNQYEVQHDLTKRAVWGTLAKRGSYKGPGSSTGYRLVFMPVNLTLHEFTRLMKYDPANPPKEDYEAQGMKKAHEQTQSDFKGAKKTNLTDFRNYMVESIEGERIAYLPPVAAWQSEKVFDETVFVAAHEPVPGAAYYGQLYLPDKPIMQSDGQTQTAAAFAADAHALALQERDRFYLTMEIELNVSEKSAAQSFVDRNGRGTKKNKNLVAVYNTVDGLPTLRAAAIEGTVFADRYHDGRNSGTGESATENIIDLSTLEQLCLNVISGGNAKAEHIKGYHVASFTPFVNDFFKMLDRVFGEKAWPKKTPDGGNPYRRLYVHGWPFALKAIALAYYESRINEIAPFYEAIKVQNSVDPVAETEATYLERVEKKRENWKDKEPSVTADVLEDRLSKVDWRRTRQHWIDMTGYPVTAEGKPKTKKLADNTEVVVGNAPNTAAAISVVKNTLLSDAWEVLTKQDDFKWKKSDGDGDKPDA